MATRDAAELMSAATVWRDQMVVITGGLGFLGSNLARRLATLGARARIIDALDPRYGGNPYNVEGLPNRPDILVEDARDALRHPEWFAQAAYVFNLAGQSSHLTSVEDPAGDRGANYATHVAVLEACRRYNRSAKIIYVGSRGQYGRIRYLPVDERHPCVPLDPYSLHKQLAESAHWFYARRHGLRVTSLRLTNLYGPRQAMRSGRQGFLNWFIRRVLDDQPIEIFGSGLQQRDFLYVEDAVDALLAAALQPAADGAPLNIGSGSSCSVLELARAVCQVLGRGAYHHVPYPAAAAPLEIGHYCADIRQATATLGWRPRVALLDGIAATAAFYQRARRHYWPSAQNEAAAAMQMSQVSAPAGLVA